MERAGPKLRRIDSDGPATTAAAVAGTAIQEVGRAGGGSGSGDSTCHISRPSDQRVREHE